MLGGSSNGGGAGGSCGRLIVGAGGTFCSPVVRVRDDSGRPMGTWGPPNFGMSQKNHSEGRRQALSKLGWVPTGMLCVQVDADGASKAKRKREEFGRGRGQGCGARDFVERTRYASRVLRGIGVSSETSTTRTISSQVRKKHSTREEHTRGKDRRIITATTRVYGALSLST